MEIWDRAGLLSNMMYAGGLWGGEWSKGEKVDACQRAEISPSCADKLADRRAKY